MRGTMTQRRPGVWRLRVVTGSRPDGQPVQASRTVRGTKREAELALAKFVAEVDAGIAPVSGAMTFGSFLTQHYLPHVRANSSPETYRNYASKIAKRIEPELGRIRLDKLTARHLDTAYGRWRSEGLQASTVGAHHLLISSALSQAVKWGLIPKSVASMATPPRSAPRRATLPSVPELRSLITTSEESDPVLSAAIFLAAVTGARRGELLGLRWTDLDRKRMTLTIERAVKRADGGERLVGATKTYKARRLAIDELTLKILDAHHLRCERWAADGGTKLAADGYILSWEPAGEEPASPDVLTTRFARLAEKVGCPQVRFHDLRHALATTLLTDGIDLAAVAARLGHSSPTITLRVYAHALEESDRQAAGVMGGKLALTNA